MSFGPIMQFMVGELQIELAPIPKEAVGAFISPGMQQRSVTKYMGRTTAPVLEDEHEWFERVRTKRDCIQWGIWLIDGDERVLIGNTGINEIKLHPVAQGTSGSMIFHKEYNGQELWGRGIASAAHKARTWYAFQYLGLHCINSAVLDGNGGSLKALQRSGYVLTHVERNESFVDGKLLNLNHLQCLNPNAPFWNQWWHGDRPSRAHRDARLLTQEVMRWVEENVTLL